MDDPEMSRPSWLDLTRSKLGQDVSQAMELALSDIAVSPSVSNAWATQSGNEIAAYALVDGWLHCVSGGKDRGDPDHADGEWDSKCEYRAFPITRQSRFHLSVTWSARPNRVRVVTRSWTGYPEDERVQPFTIETKSKPRERLSERDPETFARSLAAAITGGVERT